MVTGSSHSADNCGVKIVVNTHFLLTHLLRDSISTSWNALSLQVILVYLNCVQHNPLS